VEPAPHARPSSNFRRRPPVSPTPRESTCLLSIVRLLSQLPLFALSPKYPESRQLEAKIGYGSYPTLPATILEMPVKSESPGENEVVPLRHTSWTKEDNYGPKVHRPIESSTRRRGPVSRVTIFGLQTVKIL
jgi:hypothetical protein